MIYMNLVIIFIIIMEFTINYIMTIINTKLKIPHKIKNLQFEFCDIIFNEPYSILF